MTRNNVFVGDRRVLRRYIGDRLIFDDLANKTEVLLGTEIFTDKADEEAVVHVEVDGKSYQHAGSGKNLLNPDELRDYLIREGAGVELVDNGIRVVNFKERLTNKKPLLRGRFKENTVYTVSFTTKKMLGSTLYVRVCYTDGSISNLFTNNNLESYITKHGATQSDKTVDFLYFSFGVEGFETRIALEDAQVVEGADVVEYEPPAPSPDYPIEIHSLNDFDVVSSVGGRNYVQNNNNTPLTVSIPSNGFGYKDYKIDLSPRYPRVGDKYFLSADIDNSSGITGNGLYLRDFTNGYGGVNSNHSPKEKIGNINTITQSNVDKLVIVFRAQGSTGSTATAKNIYAINLTEHFGEGNEPSLEWCQNNLRYTPNLQDITESDNNPLINKINLLLDEPLRSVGDVKDRLFRDTDGLWKVERRIGAYIADGSENWDYNSSYERYDMQSSTGLDTAQLYKATNSHFLTTSPSNNNPRNVTWIFNGLPRVTHHGVNNANELKLYFKSQYENGTPVVWVSQIATPTIEVLSQTLQDKLNNLRTFKDSNYVYTVLPDKSNILSEKLKPTLHATFKSKGWEDFRRKLTGGTS